MRTDATDEERELGFDLPPARLEPQEPPPFSYGPTINLGLAVGAFWLIQPGQPGTDYGAGGELALITDIRPESSFPYHLRLEVDFAGASDAGAGTLAFLARWYLIGIDVGPLVDLRLGGHIGGTHYEAGYSRRCSPCEKAFEANAGLDFEAMFTIRPIRVFDWDWRLEVGVHLALTWIFDRSSTSIMAGQVGLRCAFLLG